MPTLLLSMAVFPESNTGPWNLNSHASHDDFLSRLHIKLNEPMVIKQRLITNTIKRKKFLFPAVSKTLVSCLDTSLFQKSRKLLKSSIWGSIFMLRIIKNSATCAKICSIFFSITSNGRSLYVPSHPYFFFIIMSLFTFPIKKRSIWVCLITWKVLLVSDWQLMKGRQSQYRNNKGKIGSLVRQGTQKANYNWLIHF